MKYIILLLIRVYWLVPKRKRPRCLYRETCSKHVYRITKNQGFKNGMEALQLRINTCTPYYNILEIENQRILICKNGMMIEGDEIGELFD
jgi:hypothetical protein